MKRKRLIIAGILLAITATTAGVIDAQQASKPQAARSINLTAKTAAAKPQKASAAAQPAEPTAAPATVTPPEAAVAAAPVATTPAAPTEPASCTATDLGILNNARDSLAVWKAQNGDQATPTTAVRAWTYEVTYETAQGCQ